MAKNLEWWEQRIKSRVESNEEHIRKEREKSMSSVSPAPSKTKYEYSTDSLSMLDMSGLITTDMVSTLADTAQSAADYAKGSNAYRKYLASDEDKKIEAKAISIETGIPVNALLYSDDNMAKGRSVQEFTRKRMALAPEGVNDFDMNEVYAKFPGLKSIVENPNLSDNDVAIAMHNIEDLTKAKDAAEAFSLGLAADKANYDIGRLGMVGFMGGTITPEMKKEIEALRKSIPEQKSMPNFFDDPLTAIAGGTGANIYHMNKGLQRGSHLATAALAAGVTTSVASGGTLAAPAMGAAVTAAGIGVRYGMMEDMFLNSAGRHYYEYSEMKTKDGKQLLTNSEARAFAAIAAGAETGVEFWNYGQIMNLLGVNYKKEIMEIVAKASGNQAKLKAGFGKFLQERGAQAARAAMTEMAEEAVQDVTDKAVHNMIIGYAPNAAYRKYTGAEFVKGALESSTEALPGIIGLGAIGGSISMFKGVRDFAKLQSMQSDIFVSEMKLANGLEMLKGLRENMAGSKLFKKSPEVYQAVIKSAVENTEFKEVRVDTELALQDEEGVQVFNQLVEAMGIEQEEVNAIIENKADLVVPTDIYATTVADGGKFEQYISFDDKGHSAARKKYYMAVAQEAMQRINTEQEGKQAELIDGIITANFPEEGIEQDMGAAIILTNPSNPQQAWKQMKSDTETSIYARLGDIVKKLEEGMSRGVHHYYSDESGYNVKRMSDNDKWYSDFYKANKRKPNKAELLDMARDIYKGNGEKYGMPEYQFDATEEMQADFDALDQDFENLDVLNSIRDKVKNLTASEMSVVRGLSPSGYKVYQSVRKQMESGNAEVQKAGRMNAILFARYADRMAENISKATGKEYTAEDYMRERTSIVPNATEVDENAFNHAMKREYFPSMKDFDKAFWEAPQRSKIGNWIKTKKGNEIIVTGSSYDHVQTGSHPLTIEQWQAVVDNIDEIKNIESITTVEGQVGSYGGFPVGVKIKTPLGKAGAILEFMSNGKVFLVTVVYNNEKDLDNWLKNKKNSHTLEVGDMVSQNRIMGSSFINIVQDMFDIVKTKYNQTAYHGSPHTFDTFDLGAIGTGEGAQAHGWGLYFAKDKKVAEKYREKLRKTNKVVALYDGSIDDSQLTSTMNHYFGGADLYKWATGRDLDSVHLRISEIVTYIREGEKYTDVLINSYQERIETIEKNPGISITKFMQSVPQDEAYRFKTIIEYAKEEAKKNGRRTNIQDVLAEIKIFVAPLVEKRQRELQDADFLESLDVNRIRFGFDGSFFEVDIPDSDVLLDEQKPLNEQTDYVQNALREIGKEVRTGRFVDYNGKTYKYVKGSLFGDWIDESTKEHVERNSELEKALESRIGEAYEKDFEISMFLPSDRGRKIYSELVGRYGSPEEASRKLNEHGIKGITYEGGRDGRCFVVFDDKAISVIERYNQAVRGQTKVSGMERVVSLFEKADKSTFVHEMGHVALADLKMLAEMEGAPEQVVKDWNTVKEWLGYKDSQKTFTREQHEKFARGFEAYLRTGEAPVRGLKAVFRTFKKWLSDIYTDFVQLGGKPSPEVRAVMSRMLASEQEIEAEAAMQGIESITRKKGMQFLDDSTQAMYERWVNEAKEEAKEKVLKLAMSDLTEEYAKQRQELIDVMRKDIEDSLKKQDIFRAEACVKLSGSTDILPTLGYTEEQYEAELEVYGGSLEAAVEAELQKAVADLDSEKVTEEQIKAEAEKALQTSEYKARLLAFELEAIRRKEEAESRLDASVDKALAAIEESLQEKETKPKEDSKEVKSLKQQIADLKYTYRWREAEMKLINRMIAEQDKAKMLDIVKQLKDAIASSKEGIRLVRDAVDGLVKMYREIARDSISKMPIRQATAVASWRHKERMKGAEVTKLMAKGKWEEAKKAKQEQILLNNLATESMKLKSAVDKKVNKLKKRSNSIAKGTVKLAADERYFYNHLLYVFGINRKDALMPQDWKGSASVDAMFERYNKGHDTNYEDDSPDNEKKVKHDIPEYILTAAGGDTVYETRVNIIGRKDPVKALGYGALTAEEFNKLFDVLTSVYTIGRNANRLYTVVDENGKEVSFDDAVQRIADGIRQNVRIKADEDPTGATLEEWYEKAMTKSKNLIGELIKPETIFRRNDGGKEGASMMFLYDPINRAANKKLRMMAEATKEIKAMFKAHGMKNWTKKQYQFGTSTITKEQLIVLALNWGTEINRKRVMDGYGVSEQEVMDTLSNMTEKDWQLVIALWRHIDSYWKETAAVEERMTGVVLAKQKAMPFTITDKQGGIHHIEGGYYPIMYDPTRSGKAREQEEDDLAKQQMSSNAVLETRRGQIKSRVEGKVERGVYLILTPLSRKLDDVIHNICYREAVRDVNKLVNNKEVAEALSEAYGVKLTGDIAKWVKDNWAIDDRKDGLEEVAAMLRRNMTMAVMGFRVSTAFLNLTNIFPMVEYLGASKTAAALLRFSTNLRGEWEECKQKSEFIAHRAQTMDRDVREKLAADRRNLKGKASGWFSDHAFSMIAGMDLMFAVPLWQSEYRRVWQEQAGKGLDPDVIERQAVGAGDAAVRRVFGSGDVKDLAPVQRGKEINKNLTMYYSYMNTVFNALAFRLGRGIDAGEWMRFMRSVLLWCVFTRALEEVLRALWGNDDDDIADRLDKLIEPERVGQAVGEQITGMVPIVRDIFRFGVDTLMDGRANNANLTSAYDVVARTVRFAQKVRSDEADWVDVGREGTKMVNSFTGWSDTMTDMVWTLLRYGKEDFDYEIGEVLKAVIFDQKLQR